MRVRLAADPDPFKPNCKHIDFNLAVTPRNVTIDKVGYIGRDAVAEKLGIEEGSKAQILGYKRGQRCQCYDQLDGVPMYRMFFD